MPLPSVLNGARQCQAKSKRTRKRCLNPAAYGCRTCRFHGAHRPQEAPSGEAHWNFKHGQTTQKKRAQDAIAMTKLLLLRDLGITLGVFRGKTRWSGRKPSRYLPRSHPSVSELIDEIERLGKVNAADH